MSSQAPNTSQETIIRSLLSQLCLGRELEANNTLLPRYFHLFPKLPKELRLKIWRMAVLVPRVVELMHDHASEHGVVASLSGNCPILSVNQESRSEAKTLLTYFENRILSDDGPEPITAVNCNLDTLCFTFSIRGPYETLLNAIIKNAELPNFPLPKGRRFRSVAFSVTDWMRTTLSQPPGGLLGICQIAFKLLGVEEVVLILNRRTSSNANLVTLQIPEATPYDFMRRANYDVTTRNLRVDPHVDMNYYP